MSIDVEAKGETKRTKHRALPCTHAQILRTIFDAIATCNAKHVFLKVTSKKQEADDFLSWLTGHTGVFCNRFLFTAWAELGEKKRGKKPFAFFLALFSCPFFCYLCSFWTECNGMHGHTGIFGQVCLFCVACSHAAIGIVLCVFLFLFGHAWVWRNGNGKKGNSFFVCATKGVFFFSSFISYLFHVRFLLFYRQSEMGWRTALHGFSLFHIPLSLHPSLSLHLVETIGNEDTWTTIALCVLNVAEVFGSLLVCCMLAVCMRHWC